MILEISLDWDKLKQFLRGSAWKKYQEFLEYWALGLGFEDFRRVVAVGKGFLLGRLALR